MKSEPRADAELRQFFVPVHKLAFGVAIGSACALVVCAATLAALAVDPEGRVPLHLLSNYFAGYTVSLTGAVIGGLWAGFGGFVAGWFLAFCRNFLVALFLFVVRTRAELRENRDFLDHI